MKQESKEDIQYFAFTILISVLMVGLFAIYMIGFNHMSEKEKEDVIILQMIGTPQ